MKTRKERLYDLKTQRRKEKNKKTTSYLKRLLIYLLGVIFSSVLIGFFVSVISYDYVSSGYRTQLIRERLLDNHVTIYNTSGSGIDGITYPFTITIYDVKKVGKHDGLIEVFLHITPPAEFKKEDLYAVVRNEVYEDVDSVAILLNDKRLEKDEILVELRKITDKDEVGFSTIIFDENFISSVEGEIRVEPIFKLTKFLHGFFDR